MINLLINTVSSNVIDDDDDELWDINDGIESLM